MRVFGFAGYSGSGKTTLIERVLPQLVARGLRVSVIKHTHHDFDLDQPGKDSYRHRVAGAGEVLLASGQRYAVLHELRDEAPPTLEVLLSRLAPCDLVLVEGFKRCAMPKLEVHRAGIRKPWLYPDDAHIIAVASDTPPPGTIPCIDINDIERITELIMKETLC
ncbi:MAG: molybdopterin-guanine dinucleotide biosynthesis protein B [Thiobacillaceae bacterium]